MAKEETFGTEVSKRVGETITDIKKILEGIPVVRDLKEMKDRIQGTSKKDTKDDNPFADYK